MPWLKYYEREQKVFADAFERGISQERIEYAFHVLVRRHKMKAVGLRWTSGNRSSTGGRLGIKLNRSCLSYGLLCHELAHVIHHRRGRRGHNDEHWAIMQDLIAECRVAGWVAGYNRKMALEKAVLDVLMDGGDKHTRAIVDAAIAEAKPAVQEAVRIALIDDATVVIP